MVKVSTEEGSHQPPTPTPNSTSIMTTQTTTTTTTTTTTPPKPSPQSLHTSSSPEVRGVNRHNFSRDEMMRIQAQWQDEQHRAMRGDDPFQQSHAFSSPHNENSGTGVAKKVIDGAKSWWIARRERLQKEELARQVARQRFVLEQQTKRRLEEEQMRRYLQYGLKDETREYQSDRDWEKIEPKEKSDSGADVIRVGHPQRTLSGDGMAVRMQLQPDLTQQPPDLQDDDDKDNNNNDEDNNDKNNDDEDNNNNNNDGDDSDLLISAVSIHPEPPSNNCPFILSQSLMVQIAQKGLPPSLLFAKWTRLYSLARDGDSFETMLRLVKNHPKTLLVIKSDTNSLFGGFVDSPWETRHAHNQGGGFYGSARAMLWSVSCDGDDHHHHNDNDHHDGCDDDDNNNNNNHHPKKQIVKIYKWTGANRYVQFCDLTKKQLAMGGGGSEGSFGLCVEDDFRRGSTGRCETFGNEPLSKEEQFEIIDLEVWGFITGVF